MKIFKRIVAVTAAALSLCSFSVHAETLKTPEIKAKSAIPVSYTHLTAIITLLAQIGSFVPASSAVIGVCDRIFTRCLLYTSYSGTCR